MEITFLVRERYARHSETRHRIQTDLSPNGQVRPLNTALTSWWTLDFAAFRREVKKALGCDIPLRERTDWENTLMGWRADHDSLTSRTVALETELNDRVYRLFNLSPREIAALEQFQERTRTFYPLGEP